jgi:hypothetical protein
VGWLVPPRTPLPLAHAYLAVVRSVAEDEEGVAKRGPSEFLVQRTIRWPKPSLPHSWPSWKGL